jgi:hypothetical protein
MVVRCGNGPTYSSFMLAQRGMNNAHIKQDLARVGNFVEFVECIVEFIVVVASQGRDPSLDFLASNVSIS